MKSVFDQWYDENYQKHLKHHAAYWKCKQTWLAAQKQQLEEVNELRQRVQELEFALAETEALEMSHGERIEKLTAERDKATQYWKIAEGRCDALKQQRDDLVKAMEPFVRYNSSKSVIDLAIRTSDITKARVAIASVKEKQND